MSDILYCMCQRALYRERAQSKWNLDPFRTWQGMADTLNMCVLFCVRAFVHSFLLCNMCFRGNFSGGASAKDKGHWGHRERFLCSSGFQIIQGWYKGAFCLSFSPGPSLSVRFSLCLLLNFPLCNAVPSVQRQPRPNQTFPFSAVCSQPETGFIRRSTVRRLQSGSTHTKATAGSSLPLFLSLSPPSGCADADKTQKSLLKCSSLSLWRSRN